PAPRDDPAVADARGDAGLAGDAADRDPAVASVRDGEHAEARVDERTQGRALDEREPGLRAGDELAVEAREAGDGPDDRRRRPLASPGPCRAGGAEQEQQAARQPASTSAIGSAPSWTTRTGRPSS